ncbi:MAG: radical SAM protein [Bacteroidota bacterium]
MLQKKKTYRHEWVDEFIRNIRPYVYVRTEDNLLIKRPNQATKLNGTGAQILKYLLEGGNIRALIKRSGPEKEIMILDFIIGVRDFLKGNLDEFTLNPAIEKKPFEMNFSEYPVLSELALTYRCNLKCRFCYAGCNQTANPAGSSKELNEEDFKKVIAIIKDDAKTPSISFTGGEPSLERKLLLKLIGFAKKLDMRVNLITNGTLIDMDYARDLEKAGLDSVQVSLEGITAETNDLLTRVNGSWKMTIRGIEALASTSMHVHTNTTITRVNLKECSGFPGFIKEKFGFNKFSMNLLIPAGSGIIYDELIVRYNEAGEFLPAIMQESEKQGVEFMWYSPVPMCMFNTILHGLGNKGCSACDGLISVAPNGDVLPCASYDDPVGNLIAEKFSDIWKNTKACMYREKGKAHAFCKECEQFYICNGACPIYWRERGYSELDTIIQSNTVNI